MGLFGVVAIVVAGHQAISREAKNKTLAEAKAIAQKLLPGHGRVAAYLTIGQSENKLGDKAAALKDLRVGWADIEKVRTGGGIDEYTLLDEGDFATIPVAFGIEFMRAGSLEDAKKAADSFGDSPLGKSFRHELGLQIRKDFPEAFEILAFTDAERKARTDRRDKIVASLPKIEEEPKPEVRGERYAMAAQDLMGLGANKEASSALEKAVELMEKLESVQLRTALLAQSAFLFKNMDRRDRGLAVLNKSITLDKTLTGDSIEVLRAHMMVEQSKREFGMPNKLGEVLQRMNAVSGAQTSAPAAPDPAGLTTGYAELAEADNRLAAGDKAGAIKVLKSTNAKLTLKVDPNGWIAVLVGEKLLTLGDKTSAQIVLLSGSRRYLASLYPSNDVASQEMESLTRIGRALAATGSPEMGAAVIESGVAVLTKGPTIIEIPTLGEGSGKPFRRDRKSPNLHRGAIALARLGLFVKARAMARSIPNDAHRAVALAGIVRDTK